VKGTDAELEAWYLWFMGRPFNIGKIATIGEWTSGKKTKLYLVRITQKIWKIARSDDFVFTVIQKPKERKARASENAYRPTNF
jgi:hypothetical protein